MDHQSLSLAIRWLHVMAMAVAFGGALLLTWLAWRMPADRILDIAIRYEQLFWAAAGVLVMSGVGNLGAFGLALPAPGTEWGATLTLKLSLVALLILCSLPRSLAVARLTAAGTIATSRLRVLYGATAGLLAVIAGLAEVLAHA